MLRKARRRLVLWVWEKMEGGFLWHRRRWFLEMRDWTLCVRRGADRKCPDCHGTGRVCDEWYDVWDVPHYSYRDCEWCPRQRTFVRVPVWNARWHPKYGSDFPPF